MDRDRDWNYCDGGGDCEGLAVTAAIGKVIARLPATRPEDSGPAKLRPGLQEKSPQQNGDETDATDDPSDFCDFGFNVVRNARS